MNTELNPTADGRIRPLANESEQRIQVGVVPAPSLDGNDPHSQGADEMSETADDGAPPLPYETPPGYSPSPAQNVFKALLDWAVALHLMSATDFDVEAAALLSGTLPSAVIANLQTLVISDNATRFTMAPVVRRDFLDRLGNSIPVSVSDQRGFVSVYHAAEDGSYMARVVLLTGVGSRLLRLRIPTAAEIMEALHIALVQSVRAGLFATDVPSASSSLRGLVEGQFSDDVVHAAQAMILIAAGYCEEGRSRRREVLCKHPVFHARFKRYLKEML